MKKKFPLCLLSLLSLPVSGQEDFLSPFSIVTAGNHPGKGNCQASMLPSAILLDESQAFFISHLSRIGFIKENGEYHLSCGYAKGKNTFGLHYRYQGYALLNQQEIKVSYARKFLPGLVSDIRFGYGFGNRIESRPPNQSIHTGISLIFQKGKWGISAAFLQDIALRKEQEEWNQPIGIRTAANCRIYKNLWIGADVQKDIRHPARFSAALSYLLKNAFLFFIQTQVNPVGYKLGFGYYGKHIHAELSCKYHPPLGMESSIGLSAKLASKRRDIR